MNNELKEVINKIIESSNFKSDKDLLRLKNEVMNQVLNCFSEKICEDNEKRVDFISSDDAVLELKDNTTNKLYRRSVPLSYIENSNGIRLTGEDLHGNPSEIVFLSSIAVEKIIDVTGRGRNEARCPGHEH
ncbi:MAG: hypothetical protein SPD90_11150 [Intestinibacter sp.]|uniref:hypothetical protein n=1 Tax=Intestinibacter sp. TaxID=1965304 RepID=UPI002A81425B|nr:hypothetical protein [Intestinibacter sp.]MDY4575606.1 hypothetical protein [Intestinibacter sp.]